MLCVKQPALPPVMDSIPETKGLIINLQLGGVVLRGIQNLFLRPIAVMVWLFVICYLFVSFTCKSVWVGFIICYTSSVKMKDKWSMR